MTNAEEEAAMNQVLREFDALCRETDETGATPVYAAALGIDDVDPFVWDRGHALGVRFWGCSCPGCRR